MSDEFPGPFYERCNDPDCFYAKGAMPPREHWHFLGSPYHPPESPESPL